MSGHSKWSSIKHKKGAADAKRGKLFSKLSRAIIVAAKEGGGDPSGNLSLQNAIEKAKSYSMPKDNIDRAIAKGSGADADASAFETVVYEGYGPRGVAVIVEALTDNRNRTAGDVRSFFTKAGGALAETGAVSFMFDRVGLIVYDKKAATDDAMLEAAIEAGADDVVSGVESHEVITAMDGLRDVQKALEARFGEPRKASLVWRSQTTVAVDDEAGEKILKLVGQLEEHDDVQNVYANFEISDALVAKLQA